MQVCADVKASLNLTPKVDTRLSLKKPEAEPGEHGEIHDEEWVTFSFVGCATVGNAMSRMSGSRSTIQAYSVYSTLPCFT